MTGSPGSFGCRSLHKEYGKKGSGARVDSADTQKKERETYTVLTRADVRQRAVVVRGLCHLSCRRLWQVQILSSRVLLELRFFLCVCVCAWVYNQVN